MTGPYRAETSVLRQRLADLRKESERLEARAGELRRDEAAQAQVLQDIEALERRLGALERLGAPPRRGPGVIGWAVVGAAIALAGLAGRQWYRRAGFVARRAEAARSGIKVVRQAAEIRLASSGAFACPSLDDLVEAKKLDPRKPDDPWGTPYRIECAPDETVRVWSDGPDRVPHTPDDLADRITTKELARANAP
jgi:general secretion pathway protein G